MVQSRTQTASWLPVVSDCLAYHSCQRNTEAKKQLNMGEQPTCLGGGKGGFVLHSHLWLCCVQPEHVRRACEDSVSKAWVYCKKTGMRHCDQHE